MTHDFISPEAVLPDWVLSGQFPYTMDNKRYHTLHYYNLYRYGGKVYKASLDGGCTCPNRDGTCGSVGCIYCEGGSHYFTGPGDIRQQMERELLRIRKKQPEARVIPYFQAGTNTYGELQRLKSAWQEALSFPEAVGISIATRADCLGAPVLEALEELRDRTDLTVELGLQTVHDCTAERIGRGHDFRTFLEGYQELKDRHIRVCVHLINGLPGESEAMMLETAQQVGALRPDGVKIHLLHVAEGTPLGELWKQGRYVPMEKTDYIRIVTQQLTYFPPETVIERLTGDGDRNKLLAPLWSRDKISVLGGIDREMKTRNLMQGMYFAQGPGNENKVL